MSASPYRFDPRPLVRYHRPWSEGILRRLWVRYQQFVRGRLRHGRDCGGRIIDTMRVPWWFALVADFTATCPVCKKTRSFGPPIRNPVAALKEQHACYQRSADRFSDAKLQLELAMRETKEELSRAQKEEIEALDERLDDFEVPSSSRGTRSR